MKWSYIVFAVALLALSGCNSSIAPKASPNVTNSLNTKEQSVEPVVSAPKEQEAVVMPSKETVKKEGAEPILHPKEKKTEGNGKKDSQSNTDVVKKKPNESNAEFSNNEIEKAKLAAKEYYNGTVHKVQSMEVVDWNTVYDNYSSQYEKDNIIAFSVKIKNSENPPRGIVLGRKDSNSNWKVLGEGY